MSCFRSQGQSSPRSEILHNIDILFPPKGDNLYPDIFDTRIRAAIRVGDYKLITGDPGECLCVCESVWGGGGGGGGGGVVGVGMCFGVCVFHFQCGAKALR